MASDPPNPPNGIDHAMYEFGLQGKAELSSMVIAVAVALFSILAILALKPNFLVWLSLSLAYWGFYLLGLRAFAHHQIFASIADTYIRRINPNYDTDVESAVKDNLLAKFVFEKTWKTTPYPKQTGRTIMLIGGYTIITSFLWIAVLITDSSVVLENFQHIIVQNKTG